MKKAGRAGWCHFKEDWPRRAGQGEWVYAMYNGKGNQRNQSILEQDYSGNRV